jgi:hypothetical protein
VPHHVAVGLVVTAGVLFFGAVAVEDGGLLTGSVLVLVSSPVAWLVGVARRVQRAVPARRLL